MERRALQILAAVGDDRCFSMAMEAWRKTDVSHLVHRVRDGEEVLNCLSHPCMIEGRDFKPDIVILDASTPKKNNLETLREIKTRPEWRKIPVILFSSSVSPEEVNLAYDLGANSVIQKPEEPEELVRILKTLKKYWLDIIQWPDKEM